MRSRIALLLVLVVIATASAGARARGAAAADFSAAHSANPRASLGRSGGAPASLTGSHDRPAPPASWRIPERVDSAGTCTVTGVVLDYAGMPVGGTVVELSYRDNTGQYTGFTQQTTSPSGTFSFANVPTTSSGRLWTWRPGVEYRRHNLAFGPGANDVVLRPGQVAVQADRAADPSWSTWNTLWVACYGRAGTADREIVGTSGYAYAMEPSFDYALVTFWDNEAVEVQSFASPIQVAAGGISPRSVAAHEEVAQRVWVESPSWASGPPNARITVALEGWPSGFKARFWAEMDDPQRRWLDYSTEWTSTGEPAHVTLTVPGWATPGYAFLPHAWRSDKLWEFTALDIHDFYQVCTIKPSASTVRAGTRVTISGVIPTQGHWSAQPGLAKTVTLFAHTGNAKVPGSWDPTREGWRKVATIQADGFGRYKSPALRIDRARTFVVRYPGDDWYWDAFTGTTKVNVR
jgi:hypothetical protein